MCLQPYGPSYVPLNTDFPLPRSPECYRAAGPFLTDLSCCATQHPQGVGVTPYVAW